MEEGIRACRSRLERADLVTIVADGCLLLALALIQLLIKDLVIVELLANIHVADVQLSKLIVRCPQIIASIIADADVLYIGHILMLLSELLNRVRNVEIAARARSRLLEQSIHGFLNIQIALHILLIRLVIALGYRQVDLSLLCCVD